jgi:uncharacterized membrane protein YgcG
MRYRFTAYAVVVVLLCSLANWSSMANRATGGQGSGNSWHTSGSGAGYSGGGWASGGGGGHK